MKNPLSILIASVSALLLASAQLCAQTNVVVILTDDQGYADISLNPHHKPEVETPHMDALAAAGVSFSNAYTSGHVCSPTRAGLMLGRYQQRVGVYSAGDGGRGFDPELPIFPAFLPDSYRATAIGKWHLGLDEDYPTLAWHAMSRGFDTCYKFMGRGGHSYFDLKKDSTGKFKHPIYRDKQRIDDEGYLTTRLTEEAVAFIDRNKARPFFLYLAYNAVHAPAEAPKADVTAIKLKHPDISTKRAILMAMLKHLDDGVGQVVGKLKQEGLFDDTIIFFLTDNGGARGMTAHNAPLRGFKGSLYEGGIRTPFLVSWPKRFEGGRTIATPVISLDILPTAIEAVGATPPEGHEFDGKSLLPLLTGKATRHHDTLFWSEGGGTGEWAVRRGDWKLHGNKGKLELYDLGQDPGEQNDLAKQHRDQVTELQSAFDAWLEPMAEPITGGSKRWSADAAEAGSKKKKKKKERRAEEREKRRMARRKARGKTKPRNVMFIVCDDLNTRVSTDRVRTPIAQRLAFSRPGDRIVDAGWSNGAQATCWSPSSRSCQASRRLAVLSENPPPGVSLRESSGLAFVAERVARPPIDTRVRLAINGQIERTCRQHVWRDDRIAELVLGEHRGRVLVVVALGALAEHEPTVALGQLGDIASARRSEHVTRSITAPALADRENLRLPANLVSGLQRVDARATELDTTATGEVVAKHRHPRRGLQDRKPLRRLARGLAPDEVQRMDRGREVHTGDPTLMHQQLACIEPQAVPDRRRVHTALEHLPDHRPGVSDRDLPQPTEKLHALVGVALAPVPVDVEARLDLGVARERRGPRLVVPMPVEQSVDERTQERHPVLATEAAQRLIDRGRVDRLVADEPEVAQRIRPDHLEHRIGAHALDEPDHAAIGDRVFPTLHSLVEHLERLGRSLGRARQAPTTVAMLRLLDVVQVEQHRIWPARRDRLFSELERRLDHHDRMGAIADRLRTDLARRREQRRPEDVAPLGTCAVEPHGSRQRGLARALGERGGHGFESGRIASTRGSKGPRGHGESGSDGGEKATTRGLRQGAPR